MLRRRALILAGGGLGLGLTPPARAAPGAAPCVVRLEGLELATEGEALVLRDAEGRVLRRYDGRNLARTRHGHASALLALPQRRSLLAAWPALHEWWEIPLDPDAPPIFDGHVHDHRMGEAIASPGYLGVRRIPFDGPAPTPEFAPAGRPWLAAMAGDDLLVVHLDVRRTVARFQAPGARPPDGRLCGDRWHLPTARGGLTIDVRRWRLEAPGGSDEEVGTCPEPVAGRPAPVLRRCGTAHPG